MSLAALEAASQLLIFFSSSPLGGVAVEGVGDGEVVSWSHRHFHIIHAERNNS